MKCPNCGETLKDSAKVCYACGEDVSDHEMDQLLDELINDNPEKSQNKSDKPKKNAPPVVRTKEGHTKSARFIRYATIVVILLLFVSLFVKWFGLGGRGAFLGYAQELDGFGSNYIDGHWHDMSTEAILDSLRNEQVFSLSAIQMIRYINNTGDAYSEVYDSSGDSGTSFLVTIQSLFVYFLYGLPILGILCILTLLFDKRLKYSEWVRGASLLSVIIVALNYITIKIPFLSMFAIHSQSVLREMNPLETISMNMNGLSMQNEFYPYVLYEKQGFLLAVITCILWFILSTVLVEIQRDQKKVPEEKV